MVTAAVDNIYDDKDDPMTLGSNLLPLFVVIDSPDNNVPQEVSANVSAMHLVHMWPFLLFTSKNVKQNAAQ